MQECKTSCSRNLPKDKFLPLSLSFRPSDSSRARSKTCCSQQEPFHCSVGFGSGARELVPLADSTELLEKVGVGEQTENWKAGVSGTTEYEADATGGAP